MSGKGSKPRPMSVDRMQYDKNWDAIFSKRVEISSHWSDDREIEAIVVKDSKGYFVEVFRDGHLEEVIDARAKSLYYAEDIAENIALGQYLRVNNGT